MGAKRKMPWWRFLAPAGTSTSFCAKATKTFNAHEQRSYCMIFEDIIQSVSPIPNTLPILQKMIKLQIIYISGTSYVRELLGFQWSKWTSETTSCLLHVSLAGLGHDESWLHLLDLFVSQKLAFCRILSLVSVQFTLSALLQECLTIVFDVLHHPMIPWYHWNVVSICTRISTFLLEIISLSCIPCCHKRVHILGS